MLLLICGKNCWPIPILISISSSSAWRWRVDDVIQRLRAMPGFGTRIIWFERMSDVGVSWLYERCHVFLFPSPHEGWGLPVVEAPQHGRPVITSTRGATPEAGSGMATSGRSRRRAAWRAALLAAAKELAAR